MHRAGSIVARELDQLRKRVKELTLRLEREAKAHKLDARLAAEAKKAREQLTREIKALREQGRKLASELRRVLGGAGKREQALKEARGKVAELRAGVARKTVDLKRKSGELKKLALLPFEVGVGAATSLFELAAGESVPCSGATARLSRSLSRFNSAVIMSISKIGSSGALLGFWR